MIDIDELNKAYRAGIRHALEILADEEEHWISSNKGAMPDDLTQINIEWIEDKLYEKLAEGYVW